MSAPDEDTLRRLLAGLRHGPVHITGGRCDGDSRAVNAFVELIRLTPALAAEVLRLRRLCERAEKAEAERDELRGVCDDLCVDVNRARGERDALRAAARAHLAADDALSVARRTDAADVPTADVPTAEARALAARECLAGLVGYAGEVPP